MDSIKPHTDVTWQGRYDLTDHRCPPCHQQRRSRLRTVVQPWRHRDQLDRPL